MGALIGIDADGVDGLLGQSEQGDQVEFLVDSGASTSVAGEESLNVVKVSAANRERQYKLADCSYIRHEGRKV